MKHFVLLFALALLVVACESSPTLQPTSTPIPTTKTPIPPTAGPFTLSSSAFTEGQTIPVDYSCKGVNISPALTWTEPPSGTESFALIMFDPEADWAHWTLYNIPVSTRELKENMPKDSKLSDGSVQGRTTFGTTGYGGPCPPSKHTYVFTLYALDTTLSFEVPTAANRMAILKAMEGHTLASAELTGSFP